MKIPRRDSFQLTKDNEEFTIRVFISEHFFSLFTRFKLADSSHTVALTHSIDHLTYRKYVNRDSFLVDGKPMGAVETNGISFTNLEPNKEVYDKACAIMNDAGLHVQSQPWYAYFLELERLAPIKEDWGLAEQLLEKELEEQPKTIWELRKRIREAREAYAKVKENINAYQVEPYD